MALRPKHPKCKNEKRISFSFFVFLTLTLLKTKNEKGIRFSFANLKTKNEKGIRYPFFVRKFENEKGKNGIYTDRVRTISDNVIAVSAQQRCIRSRSGSAISNFPLLVRCFIYVRLYCLITNIFIIASLFKRPG